MSLSFSAPEKFLSDDEEAWWASVDKALKGRPRQKLFETTEDGFQSAPLYEGRTDTPARLLRSSGQDWSIVQRIDIFDPTQANAQILEDLEGGASGLELVFSGAESAAGGGIRVTDLRDVEALFSGVEIELIELRLDAGDQISEILALVLAYIEKNNQDPARIEIAACYDPFSRSAAKGFVPEDPVADFQSCRDVLETAVEQNSPLRLLQADGRFWHNAGATQAQELACVLASAASYLRLLEGTALAPEDWANRISVCLVADADQVATISKARAFRALWSCVLEGADLPQNPIKLHMSTSYRMLTRSDPWVNLLRNTVAAFAAGVGGADSIGVLPHTQAIGLPDAFARRLARNTQSILLEESNLARVADPAAGAGAIEDRTEKLCAAAWQLFQEIEAAGGMFEALRQGLVQDHIAKAANDLGNRVALRKQPITGVSEFPDLNEGEVGVLESNSDGTTYRANPSLELPEPGNGQRFANLRKLALDGQSLLVKAEPDSGVSENPNAAALETSRISEPFERLRSIAGELENRTGQQPAVFLASLGSLAEFTARATWAANAFAVGGIKSVGPNVFSSLEDLVAAFEDSRAAIACIVSTDALYEARAEETARALKNAGARQLYLAGKPGASDLAIRSAGVDTYIYAGCNLLELLQGAHEQLQEIHGIDLSDGEALK